MLIDTAHQQHPPPPTAEHAIELRKNKKTNNMFFKKKRSIKRIEVFFFRHQDIETRYFFKRNPRQNSGGSRPVMIWGKRHSLRPPAPKNAAAPEMKAEPFPPGTVTPNGGSTSKGILHPKWPKDSG